MFLRIALLAYVFMVLAFFPRPAHALDFTVRAETRPAPSANNAFTMASPRELEYFRVRPGVLAPRKLVEVRLESGFFYLFGSHRDYMMSYTGKPAKDPRDPLGRTSKQLIRLRFIVHNPNKSFLF